MLDLRFYMLDRRYPYFLVVKAIEICVIEVLDGDLRCLLLNSRPTKIRHQTRLIRRIVGTKGQNIVGH